MKRLIVLLAVVLAVPGAWAQRAPDPAPLPRALPVPQEAARYQAEPDKAQLLSHRHYKTKDGQKVRSPARTTHDQVPTGASAKCRDGTYSFSQHRRGTCSHHGGVSTWL